MHIDCVRSADGEGRLMTPETAQRKAQAMFGKNARLYITPDDRQESGRRIDIHDARDYWVVSAPTCQAAIDAARPIADRRKVLSRRTRELKGLAKELARLMIERRYPDAKVTLRDRRGLSVLLEFPDIPTASDSPSIVIRQGATWAEVVAKVEVSDCRADAARAEEMTLTFGGQ